MAELLCCRDKISECQIISEAPPTEYVSQLTIMNQQNRPASKKASKVKQKRKMRNNYARKLRP